MADNTWYICDTQGNAKNAFTSNQELARRDLMGRPIIAPGHLIKYQKILVAKAKAVIKERQAKAWEEGYLAGWSPTSTTTTDVSDNPYKEVENELDGVGGAD